MSRDPRTSAENEGDAADEGRPHAVAPEAGKEAEDSSGRAQPNEAASGQVDSSQSNPFYRVELPVFEGPLDLLLHLIQKHELDILDIPIAFITEKYVQYITLMQQLNIDTASEYLVMAATLAHIKSKTLLPSAPDDGEDETEDEGDPRADLVRRLLEYQKYKLAAEQLGDRALLGRDVFSRGMPGPAVEGPAPLAPLDLFRLLDAFQTVLTRSKITVDHEVDLDRFSITDRINQLSELLSRHKRMHFEQLFEQDQSRAELIVTFLALLEMTRLRITRLIQDIPLDTIQVELAVTDDEPSDHYTGDTGDSGGGMEPDEPQPASGGSEDTESS